MNNTVELLDSVKQGLRETFKKRYYDSKANISFNMYVSDEEFRKCLMIIKKIAKEKDEEVPKNMVGCRTVEEFLENIFTSNRNNPYASDDIDMLDEISIPFNFYSNYLEESMYEVELIKIEVDVPKELTYESIVRDLNNCEVRIDNNDYAGAITSARSVVEGVCKELLTLMNEEVPTGKSDLPELFTNVAKRLKLDASNKKFDKSLKEIISGFHKIIHGLTEVRNAGGDSHSKTINPSFHHAVLAVNSAKTVTSFLFHTYEYQKDKGTLELTTL